MVGTVPGGCGEVAACGVLAGDGVAAAAPRRRRTGRYGSSGSAGSAGLLVVAGAGVGVTAAGGDGSEEVPLLPRRRIGRSLPLLPSLATTTGAFDFSGASGLAACHRPSARHVGSLVALTMVT